MLHLLCFASFSLPHFSIKTCAALFESVVAPSGTYGSQLCIPGKTVVSKFDVMRRYFKRALGLSVSTHSAMFFGEIGVLSFRERFAKEFLAFHWRLNNAPEGSLLAEFVDGHTKKMDVRVLEDGKRGMRSHLEHAAVLRRRYGISMDPKLAGKVEWKREVKAAGWPK